MCLEVLTSDFVKVLATSGYSMSLFLCPSGRILKTACDFKKIHNLLLNLWSAKVEIPNS